MRYEQVTFINFDEQRYLAANPDVRSGIDCKDFKSGFEHFQLCGNLEDRFQKITLQNEHPIAIVHIPKCAGTSLSEEINFFHPSIYKGQKYAIRGRKKSIFPTSSLEKKSKLESLTWTLKELDKARDEYLCVMGHISLNDFKQSGFKDFVVIVREPRIRLLSEMIF
jgi:hypothetical protein